MADVDITHGCGCGFKTRRLEAAIEHSDTRHHTLTVLGTIKPASRAPRTDNMARSRNAPVVVEKPTTDPRIEELRHKINRRR